LPTIPTKRAISPALNPQRLAELQRLLVEEMRHDDVGRVHRTAQFQWSRAPEQARLIQPAPARKSAEP